MDAFDRDTAALVAYRKTLPSEHERNWFDGAGLGYNIESETDGGRALRERQLTLMRHRILAPQGYQA